MFRIASLASCVLLLASFGCSSTPETDPLDNTSAGKADETGDDAGAPVEGQTYALDTDDFGGTLEILEASPDAIRFNLTVVGRFGSQPIGELIDAVAEPTDGGQLVFSPGVATDCDIHFAEISEDSIELVQVGACSDAGFGSNVDASGIYAARRG